MAVCVHSLVSQRWSCSCVQFAQKKKQKDTITPSTSFALTLLSDFHLLYCNSTEGELRCRRQAKSYKKVPNSFHSGGHDNIYHYHREICKCHQSLLIMSSDFQKIRLIFSKWQTISYSLISKNKTKPNIPGFWDNSQPFSLKNQKKQKTFSQENCTNSSNTENIYRALFFLKKQKTKRASTVVRAMHQVQLWHSSKCQGLRFHQVL